MSKEQTVVGEGHIEILGEIEGKAGRLKALGDGIKFLADNLEQHFDLVEDSHEEGNGILALFFETADSIKTLSGDIQTLSDTMQKALKYRMKGQEEQG